MFLVDYSAIYLQNKGFAIIHCKIQSHTFQIEICPLSTTRVDVF